MNLPGAISPTTTSFAAGRYYTCWLGSDSTESCVGWNGNARFGIGTGAHYDGVDYLTPVQPLQSVGGPPMSVVSSSPSTLQVWKVPLSSRALSRPL